MPNFLTSQTIDNFMTSPDAPHARRAIGLTDIEDLSGTWNSAYSTVCASSAFWDGDFCDETVFLNQISACNGNMTIDGNINMSAGNITNVDTLCASVIHSISSFTQYHDIRVSELSGFKVTGDVEVTGDVSVANITTLSGGNNTTWDSAYTTVNTASSNWNSVYNDVVSVSGDWNSVYNSVLATSADWDSTYNSVLATSADWNSVYNDVVATSADWNSVYNDVVATSGNWNSVYNSVLATSADWNSSYNNTNTLSGDWDSVYNSVLATSADWDSTYSSVIATSADWNSVYNSVLATSADWNSVYNDVVATSADWDSTYNTVYSNSASWDGDFCDEIVLLNQVSACDGSLSFDGSIDMQSGNITGINTLCATEIHSISSITHYQDIIVSELSGFNVTGDVVVGGDVSILDTLTASNISAGNGFYTDCGNSDEWCSTNNTVAATSASWVSVYNDVAATSATWNDTSSAVQANSASWNVDTVYNDSFLQSTSGGWEYTKTYVQANSASWDTDLNVVNEFQASSGGWEYTKTYVQDNSAAWDTDTVYDDTPVTALQSASAEWDNTSSVVQTNSAQWDAHTDPYDDSLLQSTSGNWDSTYTTVSSNSAIWSEQLTYDCNAVTIASDAAAEATSPGIAGTYHPQGSFGGQTQYTNDVYFLWFFSGYNGGTWFISTAPDTLDGTTFENTTAGTPLTGTYVSQLNPSGGGTVTVTDGATCIWTPDLLNTVNWDSTHTIVSANSASWDSTYTTVSSNSAEWDDTSSVVQTNSAQWAVDTDTIYDDTPVTALQSASAEWDDTSSVVQTNSATNWDNTANTLDSVTDNGATTVNDIEVGRIVTAGNTIGASAIGAIAIGGTGNSALGGQSEVLGGGDSSATGSGSTIVGGNDSNNSGNWAIIAGGRNHTNTGGARSGTLAGEHTTVTHTDSAMLAVKGTGQVNKQSQANQTAHVDNLHIFEGGFKMPTGATDGYVLTTDANGVGTWQAGGGGPAGPSGTTLSGTTSNNTQAEIFVDGVASSRMTIATDTTWMFSAMVAARSATESAGYKIEGVIKNDGGTTSLVGTAVKTVFAEEDATWDITVEADDTNDALVFKVTGDSADSVVWEVTVNKTEAS